MDYRDVEGLRLSFVVWGFIGFSVLAGYFSFWWLVRWLSSFSFLN